MSKISIEVITDINKVKDCKADLICLSATTINSRMHYDEVLEIVETRFQEDPSYISLIYSDLYIRDLEDVSYYKFNEFPNVHTETPIFFPNSAKNYIDLSHGFNAAKIVEQFLISQRLTIHIPIPLFTIEE